MIATEPTQESVHASPLATGQALGLCALAAAAMLSSPLLLLTGLSETILELALSTPLPEFASQATVLLLHLLPPLLIPIAALSYARRRHGTCQLDGSGLTFVVPGAGAPIEVPRQDVSGYDRRGSRITVHVAARDFVAKWFCPLVIQLGPGDDAGAVVRYLDACGEVPEVTEETEETEEAPPRWKSGSALPVAVGAALLVPILVQATLMPAFLKMFEETGIALPALTKLVVSGEIILGVWIGALLVVAMWGTWAKARCAAAVWLVVGLYFGAAFIGLILPLVGLIEKL